jgi:hypothetical protein
MRPTTGAEYRRRLEERRRARKLVSLPSGAFFEIRKIGLLTFSRIFRGKKTLLDEISKTQDDETKLLQLLRQPEVTEMFFEAVTRPVILTSQTGNEEAVAASDIDDMDLIVLFNEIILFNDLDKYTADRTRFFREKQPGSGSGPAGGEISSTA